VELGQKGAEYMTAVEDYEREYSDILNALRGITYEWRHWSREEQKDITETLSPDPSIDCGAIRFSLLGWEYSIVRLNVEKDWSSLLPPKRSQMESMCVRRQMLINEGSWQEDLQNVSYGRADTVANLITWLEVEFSRACHITDDDEDD
jgi:hypothetical protein